MANQLTNRRIASLQAKPIAAPKIDDWKAVLAELAKKPIPQGIAEMETAMDAYAAGLRDKEPARVMDHKFDFTNAFGVISRDRFLLGWPPGLFIPGTADWKQYWFRPPAAGMNRYTRGFSAGNSSSGNIFDPATGALFAHAAARPTDPFLRSEAGIGFFFTPAVKLATYNVEATLNLDGQHKYDVSTTVDAGGSVAEWGGVFTQAWDVSPYDGSVTAVSPYGVFTMFGQTYSNLEGGPSPTPTDVLNGAFATNIILEGGHTYLITVTAVTQIDNAWTMNNGAPMQPIPANELWKVWTWLGGTVTQVWVQTKVVYIP